MEKRTAQPGWLAVALIVLASIAISFIIARVYVSSGGQSIGSAVNVNVRSSYDISVLGDGLVYYDGAMLTALDGGGNVRWSYSAGVNADFDIGEGGIASWTSSSLSFINPDTGMTLYSGASKSPIISATVGELYGAALIGTETDAQLRVLEKTGRDIDQIDLSGEIVLDYGFFYDGSFLWVMTLDTSGSVPMSIITTYKPGKSMLGRITEIEEVVYRTLFQASQLRLVGTTYLKTYNYDGVEVADQRKLIFGWYLLHVEDDPIDPLMVFVPVSQSDALSKISDVKLVDASGERMLRMPFACESLFVNDGTLYGFSGKYVMICRAGENRAYAYELPVAADSVAGITDGNKAVIEYLGDIYYVALP